MRPNPISICGESRELRGDFHVQPSLWHGMKIAGYIEGAPGCRVYVQEDTILCELLKAETPYVLVTADPVPECTELSVVAIRSFIPMDRLESAGEMACRI